MPCVASIESSNIDAMAVCTVCYLDSVTDKTFEHVAISLHMEYLLQEYKSLSDAWKLFQGINIYRTYLGVTAIPYQSEKAPKTCSLCLVKIIELAKASYVITQTYKNGYEQKEQTAQAENSIQGKSPNDSNKPKDKCSKERWSTCPSKKVATVHPNSSTTQSQQGYTRQNAESIESRQSSRNFVKTGRLSRRSTSPGRGPCIGSPQGMASPPQNVSPPTPLLAPSRQLVTAQILDSYGEAPISIKLSQHSKQSKSRRTVEKLQEIGEKTDSPNVSGTQSQRPRRGRGRSLLERNPDFLVNVSSANDLVSKIKDSVPNVDIKLSKITEVETISGTNLEFPSMPNWPKSSKSRSPRKCLITLPCQKYSDTSSFEKCSITSPLKNQPQISSVNKNAQTSTLKKCDQDSTLEEDYISSTSEKVSYDEPPQPSYSESNGASPTYPQVRARSNPTKRPRSISEESSPRPKRSGGRSLMDRNPDFHVDTTAFKTSKRMDKQHDRNPTHSISTVSTNAKSPLRRGHDVSGRTSKPVTTVSSPCLEFPNKRRQSHKMESSVNRKTSYIQPRSLLEDTLPKWKTSQFRSKHLNLLDKALSSVGWGQKHRNAKNMEQEVFQNAQSEEAYVSKISRLVVYFSNGYQPLNSPSASSPSSIIGVQNTSEGEPSNEAKDNAKSKMEVQAGPNQEKRTRGKLRQLHAGYDHFVGTEPILEVIPIQEKKMDNIVQIVEEVATGKGGFIEPSKASAQKMDEKSRLIVKSVTKLIPVGTGKVGCTICGKQFAKRSLKNHMVKAHKDKQFLPCKICQTGFPDQEELEMHFKLDHQDINVDSLLTSESESTKDAKRSPSSQYQYVLKTGKNGKQGRRYYPIQPAAVNEDIAEPKKTIYPAAELDPVYQKTKTRKGTSPKTQSVKKGSLPEKAVVSPSKILPPKEVISDSEDMSENELHIDLEENEDVDEENKKCGQNVLLKSAEKLTEEGVEEKKSTGKSWWDINQETEFE